MSKPGKKRKPRAAPSAWTADERAYLVRHYPDVSTQRIADALDRDITHVYSQAYRLGLRKSEAFLASALSGRIQRTGLLGRPSQFQRGQEPWNKGRSGCTGTHPNTVANHFKPGSKPHTWLPVGSHRINTDGYLQIKVTDTGYPPRDWVPMHRLVWEAANGPLPPDSVVRFLPGRRSTDPAQITADALECITRRENMRRNSLHRMPKELAELVQLRGVLTRQINRRIKEDETQ